MKQTTYQLARKLHLERNYEEAYKLYVQGTLENDPKCYYGIAVFYNYGNFINKDTLKCLQIIKKHFNNILKLAENNDTDAIFIIGNCYQNNYYVERNYQKALEWYMRAKDSTDPDMQYNIGWLYYKNKEYQKAYEWYLKSAEQKYSIAQYNIGWFYYNGYYVEQNFKEAFNWYLKAAKQNYAVAQYNVGWLYYNGYYVNKDYNKAFEWYHKAAKQNYAVAQYNIGWLYYNGFGVSKDYKEAFEWFNKAVEKNYAVAQYGLGLMYMHGKYVERDEKMAFEWYLKSAKSNYKKANYSLGLLYFNGINGEINVKKASYYFKKAIKLGYNCQYAYEKTQIELGKKTYNNVANKYFTKLLSKDLDIGNVYNIIKKDLEKDFGDSWNKLEESTKTELTMSLVHFYTTSLISSKVNDSLDYSASVLLLSKSLEKEINKYFVTNYINYLKEDNVSSEDFRNNTTTKFLVDKKTKEYINPETFDFSLGKLEYIIGFNENIEKIMKKQTNPFESGSIKTQREIGLAEDTATNAIRNNKYLFEYLNSIIKEDSFINQNELANYIIDFAADINEIINLRNEAAHKKKIKKEYAEQAINYLIKSKKILRKFLELLK